VVDLIQEVNATGIKNILARGQEGQTNPGFHERRDVFCITSCEIGDQLYAEVRYNSVRLSPGNFNENDPIIYGPLGCQLLVAT